MQFFQRHPGSQNDPGLERKIAWQAEAARVLAIYDRETGLLAPWYVALRCEEECYRASRFGRPLTLLYVQPGSESDEWAASAQLADWLLRKMRRSDIGAHLGHGCFVVLMTETDLEHAGTVVRRLQWAIPQAETSLSSYPEDGKTFEELLAAARERLDSTSQLAA